MGAGKKTCFGGGFCRDFPLLEKQKHERREENKLAEHQGRGNLEVVKSRDGEKQEAMQQWGHWLGSAGCLSSWWQWDTEAVSRAGVVLTHGVQLEGMSWTGAHLLVWMIPQPAVSGSLGRRVSYTAGPFADSGRLAAPGFVL